MLVNASFFSDIAMLTLECNVAIWMAFGMTNAVMRFSMETISENGSTICCKDSAVSGGASVASAAHSHW